MTDKTSAALDPMMLPRQQQLVVTEVLQTATASYSELPWRYNKEIDHYDRLADVHRHVLFELGITPPRAPEFHRAWS